jgi:Sec-independent protein translocase protein TatA
MDATTNGLGQYMQLANLTVVGALILVIVVCTVFLVTKGIPKAIEHLSAFVNGIMDRNQQAQTDAQDKFIEALNRQAQARVESAKGGHDAAMRIADNLHDLTREVHELRTGKPPSPSRSQLLEVG